MYKKICVIGTGYVGLIVSVGLADFGNYVVGVDIDENKVKKLNEGISPIYEAGVEEYLKKNLESKRLKYSIDIEDEIRKADIVFIAVGTPESENGEADLTEIFSVVNTISNNLHSYKVIITKSTVPVGTNRKIHEILIKNNAKNLFDVISNPEFLREGSATKDFLNPDRTVIGYENEKAVEIIKEIYRALYRTNVPFIWCNWETAEMIKYCSNAFLATKIAFINQMSNLSERVGSDIKQITQAMGLDGRISSKFLHPGPGFGGSCFPKDTKAIESIARNLSVDLSIVKEVIDANERQKTYVIKKIITEIGNNFSGKTFGILGLSFKKETDDIRESASINIVNEIIKRNGNVKVFDPKAMENFKKLFPDLNYCENIYSTLKEADVIVIITEWNEFRTIPIDLFKKLMRGDLIFDTRNIFNPEDFKKSDLKYFGFGR